ncbi:hypothetical protein H9Y04_33500 [Streptomyces sp. TRM66268-LWL]|uniref:Lipoprotein n=1 Tax=Streptomyces polyasparticus TaxID=2767826 RepID=A0ABR7SPQ1_9ACTN|nr:hypothetical protein [Streptomyces polyasparticus]MBC9717457.1 hypothetical protein [Streptomyces polyasparticus]
MRTAVHTGAVTLVGVLLAAGCGSGDGDGDWLRDLRSSASADGGADGDGDAKEPPPSPSTTPPMSDAAYDALLAEAIDPLNAALGLIGKAKSDKAADEAFTAAGTAAGDADRLLRQVDTPDRADLAHQDLLTALAGVSGDLENTEQGRTDGTLCTGKAAVARFGSQKALGTLDAAAQAVSALGYTVDIAVPKFPKETTKRLSNGRMVKDGSRGGRGVLKIDGADQDAVVTFARGGKAAFSVYVRKNSKTQVQRISDGTYTIYFTTGEDWNASARGFNRSCAHEKFEKKAPFKTTTTSTRITYTIFTIGLKTTIGGNSPVAPVAPGDIPK